MWIFLALASRFLWAGCNAIDQVLSRAHKTHRTAAVTALELTMDLPVALAALAMSHSEPWAGPGGPAFFAWLACGVAAQFLALIPYYRCLQQDESYNIVPYMEMIPVFLTLLAVLVRGEPFGLTQALGGGLIILCGFLFSWDFDRGRFRPRVFALMALCSFLFAFIQFAMRQAEAFADVWSVTGWFFMGSTLAGLSILVFRPAVRRVVIATAVETKGATVALSLFSNTLSFLANASLVTAFVRAPTMGHVAGLSGVQPFFAFFLAVLLGRLVPRHYKRVGFTRETKAKLFLLGGILAGVWILAHG